MSLHRTTALIIAIVFAYSGVTSAQSYRDLARRADQARDAERLDEAADLYRKALVLRPGWVEGWWSLGTIQYDKNQYPSAARSFRRLVAIQPKSGNALAMLGLCEFELGQDDQALKHIQASRQLGLANDEQLRKVVLYHEGVLLQRAGKFESAQQTFEQLCLLGVDSDDVANALGMTLLRSTAKTPPIKEAKDSDVVLRVGRAECFAGHKKYDEGKKLFSEVVAEHPEYPNIHYAYGLFLEEMRDIKGAVSAYQEEIKRDPQDVFSRLRIAAATYKEDSATGLPYAEEAVKLNPSLPFGHYLLGLLLLDTDQFQHAIPELELARTAYPSDAKIYFALGSAYARAGRREDAARARARFAELNQKNGQSASADQD